MKLIVSLSIRYPGKLHLSTQNAFRQRDQKQSFCIIRSCLQLFKIIFPSIPNVMRQNYFYTGRYSTITSLIRFDVHLLYYTSYGKNMEHIITMHAEYTKCRRGEAIQIFMSDVT